MTKEITPAQAMQYLEMLVALDNTQIAKDTFEYFKQLEEESKKQKAILDILKNSLWVEHNIKNLYFFGIYETSGILTKEQYDILKEWLDND